MVDVKQSRKDMNFTGYDKVYEDFKVFEEVLPFMKPKLEGRWSILVLEPPLDFVRTALDTGHIPSYVDLTLAVEPSQLQQLYLERPKLAEEEKTPWGAYMELISRFPVPMDDKAMRELYYRVGPKEDKLAEALNSLLDLDYVTMSEINKRWAPVRRAYASQVVREFMVGRSAAAWKMLSMLEAELGSTVAFYAMRKATRRLFTAKTKYLQNQQVKERFIDRVSVYDITLLYWLFEEATDPYQLYPIMFMYERRQTNACCQ